MTILTDYLNTSDISWDVKNWNYGTGHLGIDPRKIIKKVFNNSTRINIPFRNKTKREQDVLDFCILFVKRCVDIVSVCLHLYVLQIQREFKNKVVAKSCCYFWRASQNSILKFKRIEHDEDFIKSVFDHI